MYTIVALGNPGEEYANTRHNAGRLVMQAVLQAWQLPSLVASAAVGGLMSEGVVAGREVRVIFPGTYMNESGGVVAKVARGTGPERLAIVYDDVDIPLGEYKLSFGRGNGGHNGLRSVIDALGTPDFFRVRVGIAPRSLFGTLRRPRADRLAGYVLGTFSAREAKRLQEVVPAAAAALETWLRDGKEAAMSTSRGGR